MTLVKFCGMTRDEDVEMACGLGVDALGFVLWPGSPRGITLDRAREIVRRLPAAVMSVGVFVNPSIDDLYRGAEIGLQVMQIHGRVPAGDSGRGVRDVWLAATVDADLTAVGDDRTILLDAGDPVRHGGTGRTIDWGRAGAIARRRRVVLAGGLTPHNVAAAIAQVRPFGVDVASGIEERPGVKSAQAMTAFAAAVREARV